MTPQLVKRSIELVKYDLVDALRHSGLGGDRGKIGASLLATSGGSSVVSIWSLRPGVDPVRDFDDVPESDVDAVYTCDRRIAKSLHDRVFSQRVLASVNKMPRDCPVVLVDELANDDYCFRFMHPTSHCEIMRVGIDKREFETIPYPMPVSPVLDGAATSGATHDDEDVDMSETDSVESDGFDTGELAPLTKKDKSHVHTASTSDVQMSELEARKPRTRFLKPVVLESKGKKWAQVWGKSHTDADRFGKSDGPGDSVDFGQNVQASFYGNTTVKKDKAVVKVAKGSLEIPLSPAPVLPAGTVERQRSRFDARVLNSLGGERFAPAKLYLPSNDPVGNASEQEAYKAQQDYVRAVIAETSAVKMKNVASPDPDGANMFVQNIMGMADEQLK